MTGVRFAIREQVTKPIKTLPGTISDRLRQRLEDISMPREEAERVLRKWAHNDPNRIVWHLDEVARLRKEGKVQTPLAWLRAGLKKDYRPGGSLFDDRAAEKEAVLKKAEAMRSNAGMEPVATVLAKFNA